MGDPPHITDIPARHRVPSHLARRFHQICLGASAEVLEPAGITPGEFGLLAAVQDMPNLEQRSLARALGIDAVSAGHMIDRLEGIGLLQRRVDPGDRRARLLSATPKGVALRERFRPAALDAQERIMAALTPEERQTFLHLLTRIVETNQIYARPGNGRRRPRRSPTSNE
jgi:DNA-binding MarR family transcriptional regulator